MTSQDVEAAAAAGRRLALAALDQLSATPGMTLRRGTVTALHTDDGYLTADVSVAGGTLSGLPMTTACANAQIGNRVLVETYSKYSVITGVIGLPGAIPGAAHPVGQLIWLKEGVTPADCGYAGTWTEIQYVNILTTKNFAIDVKDGTQQNGQGLQIYQPNTSDAQKWKFYSRSPSMHFFAWVCVG